MKLDSEGWFNDVAKPYTTRFKKKHDHILELALSLTCSYFFGCHISLIVHPLLISFLLPVNDSHALLLVFLFSIFFLSFRIFRLLTCENYFLFFSLSSLSHYPDQKWDCFDHIWPIYSTNNCWQQPNECYPIIDLLIIFTSIYFFFCETVNIHINERRVLQMSLTHILVTMAKKKKKVKTW